MEKLISYILPAYNVEKFITECMKSLIQQNLSTKEYEIIVVNDGSTDGTEKQIKAFINTHPESDITLISKQNAGVSAARNEGLTRARGKYVWFVDPDDFILCNCMDKLRPYLMAEENALFYLDAKSVEESTTINSPVVEHEISIDAKNKKEFKHCGPWTKIVNRQFLIDEDIKFCERLAYGEDFLWNHMVSHNCKKAAREYYINGFIYYYRIRKNSAYRSAKDSRASNNKLYQNFIMLAEEYEKLRNDSRYAGKKLKTVTNQAKQAAIFALVFLDRDYFELELQKLKNRGMYPYSFVWEDWKPEISLKHTLVNWAMFFLPIKSYARLLNKIVGKKRK